MNGRIAAATFAAVLGWAAAAAGQGAPSADPDSTLEAWIDALPEGVDAESAREALERAPSWQPAHAGLTLVTGARQSALGRARWRGWSALGRLSRTGEAPTEPSGGVAWRGRGWLESVAVGGVRPRLAEGALVGVRASDYAPARSTPGPGGLVMRPSATATGALLGAGAALRLGRWRAAVGGWRPRSEGVGPTGWASLARAAGHAHVGAALGWVGGEAGAGTPAGSVFAAAAGPGLGAAVEAARVGSGGSVLARAWSGGRAGNDWCVEAFADGDGAGFGEAVVGEDDFRGRRTGGAWHRTLRRGRATGRVSLFAVSRTRVEDRRRRLRLQFEGRRVAGPADRLEWLLRLDDDRALVYGTGGDPPVAGALRSGKARLRLSVADGPLSQRFEVSVQAHAGERPGVVVGWRGAIAWRTLEMTAAANAWALPAGETGYYARPGAAGYETLGVASRQGSDLSARVAWRFGPAALCAYVGGREGSERRWLLSLDLQA